MERGEADPLAGSATDVSTFPCAACVLSVVHVTHSPHAQGLQGAWLVSLWLSRMTAALICRVCNGAAAV